MFYNTIAMKIYTPTDHKVRATIFAQQKERIMNSVKVSRQFLEWFDKIQLPEMTVPDAQIIGSRLEELVWRTIVNAGNEYLSWPEWFTHLVKQEFPCTDYIRGLGEIDFTPMPDLFHEYFGHMPLMAQQWHADIQHHTAKIFLDNPERQDDIYTLSRYSAEYWCLREDGDIKALWAGILSSPWDLQRFCAGEINLVPATQETILQHKPSPHKPHQTLFVFDSIEHMWDVLRI